MPASRFGCAPQRSTVATGWPCFSPRLPGFPLLASPLRHVIHFVLRWARLKIAGPNLDRLLDDRIEVPFDPCVTVFAVCSLWAVTLHY